MKIKYCPYCKTYKPADQFYKNRRAKNGLSSYCKVCYTKYAKSWRKKHPNYMSIMVKRWSQERKRKILTHYGGGKLVCIQCGYADIRALSVDHIEGEGTKHRKSIRLMGGRHFYKWLIDQGFPEGYQTLCMNCQFIKQAENKEYRKPKELEAKNG